MPFTDDAASDCLQRQVVASHLIFSLGGVIQERKEAYSTHGKVLDCLSSSVTE